jgi:hypothetical protein
LPSSAAAPSRAADVLLGLGGDLLHVGVAQLEVHRVARRALVGEVERDVAGDLAAASSPVIGPMRR